MLERRGFLHGLVALPLIGGRVTLIGRPTRAAVPVSKDLLQEYSNFLGSERSRVALELYDGNADAAWRETRTSWLYGPSYDFHCESPPASTRAALVLATVGIDWTKPGR